MYRRILVAVDGSAASALAVDEALGLARANEGEVRVAHVIEWPLPPLDLGWPPELVRGALWRDGERILEDAVERARRCGMRANPVLLEAHGVSRAIVEEARHWPAEVIVLGTHGRCGVARLLPGGTVEGVIRAAPVPVLVVRAGDRGIERIPALGRARSVRREVA